MNQDILMVLPPCRFGATAKLVLNIERLFPPSNLSHHNRWGRIWSLEGFTSEVVTMRPLINAEFNTSLATQLPVESDQPLMSNPLSEHFETRKALESVMQSVIRCSMHMVHPPINVLFLSKCIFNEK